MQRSIYSRLAIVAALAVSGLMLAGPAQGQSNTNLICVHKFYDVNLNGIRDPDEVGVGGWKIALRSIDCAVPIRLVEFTDTNGYACFLDLPNGTYVVTELPPDRKWVSTTPTSQRVPLPDNGEELVCFGNVCLGPCTAKSPQFWVSMAGRALFEGDNCGCDKLDLLASYFLVDAAGRDFDPQSYDEFKQWVRYVNTYNMAYALSVELAVMVLNDAVGCVDLGLLIYAPGSQSSDDYGFAAVGEIVVEADDALACCGFITPRHRDIRYYKALQKALDDANDNLNFLQSKPCPFDYNAPAICRPEVPWPTD